MNTFKNGEPVTYVESTLISGKRIGEYIEHVFSTTSPRPLVLSVLGYNGSQETNSYNIMVNKGGLRKFLDLFGIYLHERIGQIFFENSARGAVLEKKWVLEVYGRSNVEYFKMLAAQLASHFEVEVQVQLQSEQPRSEYL